MTRRIWPLLRSLAGAGILAALVWRLGTDAFTDGVRLIDSRAVLAALGIGLVTTVLSAWRWCLVAHRLGLRLPLATAVADYYRAQFLNVVLPAGVLGDAHRAVSHGQRVGDVGRGVRAVVLERMAGQAVLIAFGVAVLLAQPTLATAAARGIVSGPGYAAAVLSTLAAVATLAAWIRWGRGAARWRQACAAAWAEARLLARGTWPGVVALSAAAVAGHVALFLVAARTAGSSAPLVELVPLIVLALVVMALPVNVGGWGPREAFLALAFGVVGLGAAHGLTTAVVGGVLTFVASLPGAAVLVLRSAAKARSGAARTEIDAEPSAQEEARVPATSAEPKGKRRTTRPSWRADLAPSGRLPATVGR